MSGKKVKDLDPRRAQALSTAVELVHFAYRAMIARPDRVLAARGLTRVHHRILYFVARLPGTSVNTLLRTLGVTKQALNAPLRELYAQGLVTEERSPDDARVKRLALSPAGQRLERRLSTLQRAHFAAAFAAAGPEAEAGWRIAMRALAAPELARSGRVLQESDASVRRPVASHGHGTASRTRAKPNPARARPPKAR